MKFTPDQVVVIGRQIPALFNTYSTRVPMLQGVGLGIRRRGNEWTEDDALTFFTLQSPAPGAILETIRLNIGPAESADIATQVILTLPFQFSVCFEARPVRGGNCIAGKNTGQSSTMGGVVTSPQNDPYIITASHGVTAKGTYGVGHPVLQPYVNNDSKIIGEVFRTVEWKKNVTMKADSALVEPKKASYVSADIYDIGAPKGIEAPALRMPISKHGGTSDLTKGTIECVVAKVVVDQVYFFENITLTDKMSDFGDSGSLGVNSHSNVIGLLFAQNKDYSMYANVYDVIDTLSLQNWRWY